MYTVGIDIGSVTAKGALMKGEALVAANSCFTGYNAGTAALTIYERLLADHRVNPEQIRGIVATGYGRNSVPFATKTFTEIMCHAAGARHLNPAIRAVIDIGGQDSKAIILNDVGNVANFVMNDKCAAGTGRFLEVMARALEVDLDNFGALSLAADSPAPISSLCAVFAESEVVSLIARGEKRENIIAGIHKAIASRVAAMAARLGIASAAAIMMTGGVAKNIGVVKALEEALGYAIAVSPQAQMTGAIGAARLAQTAA
ncbi:MAG: 2-hydroxyglutaryl-CoA dehydratase [Deltaproteobacteria bacterium]|nr:2-hydroxyglutaryl-CoA dehydratase [Deltaproteobacteria bacterium]